MAIKMVSGTIPTYHIEPFKVQYTFLNQIKYKKYEGCDLIENYSKLYYTTLILLFTILILPSSYAVTLTDTYISGYGIASGIHEGYYTHFQFENYCPMCGCHGTLQWNPKGTREGEITCSHCDSDYSVSGKDKTYRPRAWLTLYVPEPEASVPETVPPPLTPWQKAHTCFKNNQIMIIT